MRPLILKFALLLLVFVPEAIASHFRGAAMVPSVSATGLVTVTSTSFWRRNAPGLVQPRIGNQNMIQVGSPDDDLSDSRFLKRTQVHTFQLAAPGLYQITWGSGDRVAGILNANESSWEMNSAIRWNGETANTPIQFNFSAVQSEVVRGSDYTGNLNAVAGLGVTLSYNQDLNLNINSQPPGFTINPSTGALFIPASSTANYGENTHPNSPGADYAFSGNIIASDGSRVEFDWLFDAVNTGTGNLAPTVTDVTLNAAPGQTITHTVTGTDPNNDPLTFSFVTMLGPTPAIAPTFDPSTRVFTWNTTGSPVGTYLAQFQARDPGFLTDIGTVTINLSATPPPIVTPPPSVMPLALTALLPTIEAGSQISHQFSVSGGVPPYTFSAAGLPPGVSLSPTGVLVGIFSTSIPVSFTITIADSAGNTLVIPFNIQIAPRSLTINTFSLPEGMMDEVYSASLSAFGGTPPYSWSKTTGTLPPGLDLDGSGRITGIPTSAGSYQFGVEVTDSGNGRGTGSLTITVKPPLQGLLQVSETGLTFDVPEGGAVPPAQSVTVTSGNNTATRYTMHGDGAPWLTVGAAGGITPGNLSFAVNPAGRAPGEYISNTLLRGPHNNVSISVRMRVRAVPPQLSVSPALLRFNKRLETQTTLEGQLNVANSGGGGPQNVGVLIETRSAWLKAIPSGTEATPSAPVRVQVEANTQGLPVGAYYDVIRVTMGTLSGEVPVSLFVSPTGPNLALDTSGVQFQARQGNGTTETRDITVTNLGSGSFSWTAEVVGSSPWLKLATIGSTVTPTAPGILRISVDAQPLAEGAYYGLVRVNAPGTVNTTQFVLVVLNVVPPSTPPQPSLSPAGLLFVAPAGGNAPAAQNIRITTSSTASLPFQAAVTTVEGGNWLTVTPRSGTVSTQTPGVVSARVNTQGLKPGFYPAEISFTVNNPIVRTANVLLVVTAPPGTAALAAADGAAQRRAEGCTPSAMAPLSSGLVNNFSVQAGWPTPLSMRLVDNCGEAVGTGQAVVSFSNGDPPIVMPSSDPRIGLYSATWTPVRVGSQIAVSVQVTAPGLAPIRSTLTGTVNQNQAPALSAAGTVNIFNRRNGAPLAPGTIVEVYGSNLAIASALAVSAPLPKNLGGTAVVVGGVEAPLYFTNLGQVNAQIPTELAPNREYQVMVSVGNALAGPETITLTTAQPAIATLPGGRALAQHADFSLIDSANPARPGGAIILYLTGMGATNPAVASAAPAPRTEPLARVVSQPTVTVDGQPAEVFYAGLTPDAVGLYQITLRIPQGVQAGDVNVVVTQEGVQSNTVTLPVRRE